MESYDDIYSDLLGCTRGIMASVVPTKKIDLAWRRRLNKMLAPEYRARPDLLDLREVLLDYGGGEALLLGNDNSVAEVQKLLAQGKFWNGKPEMRVMRSNECHGNSRELCLRGLGQMASGFGLSADGLWRQHSWIVTPQNTVVETTTPRVAYFGVILDIEEVRDVKQE